MAEPPAHSHDRSHDPAHDPAAAVFSGPAHDHTACRAETLDRAERICAARGQRLTPQRKAVLEALAATHAPLGAYEVMDRLAAAEGRRPAPVTIYRALDFLLANGLAHRIESRNAYVACAHAHGDDIGHGGALMFMLCDGCGAVGEVMSDGVADALSSAAVQAGFALRAPVIEVTGLCTHCRTAREHAGRGRATAAG